jgi:hypothetical protein
LIKVIDKYDIHKKVSIYVVVLTVYLIVWS